MEEKAIELLHRKCYFNYHDFFLSLLITQTSKPCHGVVYQAIINNHKRLEILDDLITKFCQQFDFLTVLRLLNSFKSQGNTNLGASFGLTPFCTDFTVYVRCNIDIRDISKLNKVVHDKKLLQQMVIYYILLPFLTIIYLIFDS